MRGSGLGSAVTGVATEHLPTVAQPCEELDSLVRFTFPSPAGIVDDSAGNLGSPDPHQTCKRVFSSDASKAGAVLDCETIYLLHMHGSVGPRGCPPSRL